MAIVAEKLAIAGGSTFLRECLRQRTLILEASDPGRTGASACRSLRMREYPLHEYRRHLPHFHPHAAFLFLTWRLWGPLPSSSHPPSAYLSKGHAFVAADRALDQARSGPRWLAETPIATLVSEAIIYGERDRRLYELAAWVVMPNHVHLLILPNVPFGS